jgi:LysM repeat protein
MNKNFFLLIAISILSSGCETLTGKQRRQSELRTHGEMRNIKASIQRLEERLDGIEAGREDLYEQISDLRATQGQVDARRGAELRAIESKLAAEREAQERARKAMVDKLSKQVSTIVKTQAAATSSRRSESGYEHVVKGGETLSEIAKAYGVRISVITKANKLKNPDDLRLGQTLFIPE